MVRIESANGDVDGQLSGSGGEVTRNLFLYEFSFMGDSEIGRLSQTCAPSDAARGSQSGATRHFSCARHLPDCRLRKLRRPCFGTCVIQSGAAT